MKISAMGAVRLVGAEMAPDLTRSFVERGFVQTGTPLAPEQILRLLRADHSIRDGAGPPTPPFAGRRLRLWPPGGFRDAAE